MMRGTEEAPAMIGSDAGRREPWSPGGWVPGIVVAVGVSVAMWVALQPSTAVADFGIESFESQLLANESGPPAVRAGSHPYAMSTTIVFNNHETEEGPIPDGNPRDIEVNLPKGVIVDPTATPAKCTEAQLESNAGCPNSTAIGVAIVNVNFLGAKQAKAAVYNMVPPANVPAELGMNVEDLDSVVHIVGGVRTGGDYGISAEVSSITQRLPVYGTKLTLWGDPSSASHDAERGACFNRSNAVIENEKEELETGALASGLCAVERTGKALLTLPSECAGASVATMRADSWQEPGLWTPLQQSSPAMPEIEGCARLDFSPTLTVRPSPSSVPADSPSGLNVALKIPQQESTEALAEANLMSAVVTLPEGFSVSAAAAAGLAACTPEEIGLNNANPPTCPEASKLGSVEVLTPLLEHPLGGAVYLAQQGDGGAAQGSNPFNSLIALYLVAEGSGVLVKLPGHVELGGQEPSVGLQPGQVRATFGEDPLTGQFLPELPFGELKMSFFGGPRGALSTPSQCGGYTTTSRLTPYGGSTPATLTSEFVVGSGCGGGFEPSFTAGTSINQAGGFSPFSVVFSRKDGEQNLAGITVHMPPGLLGKIANVPQCPEPQAQAGSCPESSKIGDVSVAAGAGPEPYWITRGRAYFTGPYDGAPYGLSIVVPTEAGPFNLGPEVVRAAIFVDPNSAALTIVSTPLPTIKDGVPFQIKEVVVDANRKDFVFNPTSCEQLHVEATIGGAPPLGSTEAPRSAQVSSPLAVAGCRNLPFNPSFSASTQALAHRLTGASLTVKVAQKAGEANIRQVDLQLPTKLPARLATLRKACTEVQFAANPAGCPPESVIGEGSAVTPVLSVPLTGPAYIVSHGGAAYPDVVFVLQGAGVRIDLTGGTQIKKDFTFSRFETVPDAPISSFEASLPEGPHSALTSNLPGDAHEDFCGQNLTMPTTITAQNGARVVQATKVGVTGCLQHKTSRHKAKKRTTKKRTTKPRKRHKAKQPKRR